MAHFRRPRGPRFAFISLLRGTMHPQILKVGQYGMLGVALLAGLAPLPPAAFAEVPSQLNVMPMPASVQMGTGQLTIDRTFSVSVTGAHDEMVDRAVDRFKDQLNRKTAILLQKPSDASHTTLTVQAEHGSQKVQKVGDDESYDLVVTESSAKLSAPNPLG